MQDEMHIYKLGIMLSRNDAFYRCFIWDRFHVPARTRNGFSVVPAGQYDVNVDLDTCGNYAASDAKNITGGGDPA